ncbi:MAG: AtpZ/AtpI family protein [Clostridia bacterium]|nr:AtpZ/AtpI family protein [Clostridia bacterium]
MYSKFVHAFYYFNIIVQSVFSLLCPVGLLTLLAWFLTSRNYTGEWIYAVLILFGIAIGLFSMFRFITDATAQVRALEKAAKEKEKEKARRITEKKNQESEDDR